MPSHVTRLALLAATTLTLGLLTALCPAADHPNIVLIFTDDQGYGDVGCFGAEGFKTPHLDRMADEGMRFTDFYVNCPVCSGSRTALMTGCHYPRLSMAAVLFPGAKTGLNPAEITVAEMLKPQGYATACIGKWHLGHLPPFLPRVRGSTLTSASPTATTCRSTRPRSWRTISCFAKVGRPRGSNRRSRLATKCR